MDLAKIVLITNTLVFWLLLNNVCTMSRFSSLRLTLVSRHGMGKRLGVHKAGTAAQNWSGG